MSDPAVVAAQRVIDTLVTDGYRRGEMESAARMALQPIREWYEQNTQKWVECQGGVSPLLLDDLAQRIYSSEELER